MRMNCFSRSSRATGPEDARSAWLTLLVQENGSVLIEPDVRTVWAAILLAGTYNNGAGNFSFLDVATRDGRLDRDDDLITHTGISTSGTTENTDTKDFLRTTVVGNFES